MARITALERAASNTVLRPTRVLSIGLLDPRLQGALDLLLRRPTLALFDCA